MSYEEETGYAYDYCEDELKPHNHESIKTLQHVPTQGIHTNQTVLRNHRLRCDCGIATRCDRPSPMTINQLLAHLGKTAPMIPFRLFKAEEPSERDLVQERTNMLEREIDLLLKMACNCTEEEFCSRCVRLAEAGEELSEVKKDY